MKHPGLTLPGTIDRHHCHRVASALLWSFNRKKQRVRSNGIAVSDASLKLNGHSVI